MVDNTWKSNHGIFDQQKNNNTKVHPRKTNMQPKRTPILQIQAPVLSTLQQSSRITKTHYTMFELP
jgi:hypothetical protein